jgi:hypothetical protein
MSYEEDRREHVRLSILRTLENAPAYRANDSVIRDTLGRFGLASSRDEIRTALAWLAEQGLVELEEVGPYAVGTLTSRGADVASGAARVPGVKRPAPR